jgi:hypothetical protein
VLRRPGGATERLPVFSDPTGIDAMFYDLRLLEGVDLVYTSGSVRGRYEAEPARYEAEARWYAFLDGFAERVAWLRPGRGVTGPEIRVYRLGERARAELARRAGALDPLWWAEALPLGFRRAYETRAVAPADRTDGAVRGSDGNPAPWVRGMGAFFAEDVRPFVEAMAFELAAAGRTRAALPLAEAIHLVFPGEVGACLAVVACAKAAGEWRAAEGAIDRTLAAVGPSGPAAAALRLERGRVLALRGERARARSEFEWVLAHSPPDAGPGLEARAELARLAGPRPR